MFRARMLVLHFLIIFPFIASKYIEKESVAQTDDNNCFMQLNESNTTIILKPSNCTNQLCSYFPNQNCTWRINNTLNFIKITNTPGCINKADSLSLTDCRGNTLLTNYDFETPLKFSTGEPEVCVDFVSNANASADCTNPSWLLNFTMDENEGVGMEFEMMGDISHQDLVNVDYIHMFSDAKDFEICFTNSYGYVYNASNLSDFHDPLYAVWKYPNLTGFIDTFRLEDHLKCFESVNNTLTIYTNRFSIGSGADSSILIWTIVKSRVTENCVDTTGSYFSFIYPIGERIHFKNGATDAGDCKSSFEPASPSYESVSPVYPTVCFTNIFYEGNEALQFFQTQFMDPIGKKLFECTQETCKLWNNTCINGGFIKSTIPSGGNASFDLISIDYQTVQMFMFDEEQLGVLTSRNYGYNYSYQNTTQQIVSNTGIAQFNLTFVDIDFSENYVLVITTDNQIYPYSSLNELSNIPLIFNSTKVTIDYRSKSNDTLYSTGFLMHYKAEPINAASIESASEHSRKHIVIGCIVGVLIVAFVLCAMVGIYRFKFRATKNVT